MLFHNLTTKIQKMLDRVRIYNEKLGLYLNVEKRKVMIRESNGEDDDESDEMVLQVNGSPVDCLFVVVLRPSNI